MNIKRLVNPPSDPFEGLSIKGNVSDGYILNRSDSEWRRILSEMSVGWVSFYGAKKVGHDHYKTDKSRLFIGTRNPDFIPPALRAKGVMESGTTWDMSGDETKQDYIRFFDRVRGEWRSTYKAYTVAVGKIPADQQIPYTDWVAEFGSAPADVTDPRAKKPKAQ